MQLSNHSFLDLVDIVHNRDRCSQCGACIAVCPFDAIVSKDFCEDDSPTKGQKFSLPNSFHIFYSNKCTSCGLCFNSCPVINWDLTKAEEQLFGKISDNSMGNFEEIWKVRATDKKITDNAQNGGAVTALLKYALDSKIAECAIVTRNNNWYPQPVIAYNIQDLMASQKTKYTSAHALELYTYESSELMNKSNIAVFTPCQVHGFYTLRQNSHRGKKLTNGTKVIIGTFCYGVYDRDKLFNYIVERGIKPNTIKKIEIDKEHFRVYGNNGLILLDEDRDNIYDFLNDACKYCHDFTNSIADISVGAVGSDDNQTTVIIRTEIGKKLFHGALDAKYISVEEMSSFDIEKIKDLTRSKMEKGVVELSSQESSFSKKVIKKIKEHLAKKQKNGIKPRDKIKLNKNIHSVYIVADSGIPLFSYPTDADKDTLIGGVFAALTLLINSMSRGRRFLKKIDYSDRTILLENREGFIVAILVNKETPELKLKLNLFADEIAKRTYLISDGLMTESPSAKEIEHLLSLYLSS